jgi:hypothetical protein
VLPRLAQHDRPLPCVDVLHRAEWDSTSAPPEQAPATDDDLVRVVSVPLVADVLEPADVRAVTGEHSVALRGGEQTAQFGLCPVVALDTLVPTTLPHGQEE